MLEFWIEVWDDADAFVAVVHELIVHDQVSDRGFVYDVRFTTARHKSSDADSRPRRRNCVASWLKWPEEIGRS